MLFSCQWNNGCEVWGPVLAASACRAGKCAAGEAEETLHRPLLRMVLGFNTSTSISMMMRELESGAVQGVLDADGSPAMEPCAVKEVAGLSEAVPDAHRAGPREQLPQTCGVSVATNAGTRTAMNGTGLAFWEAVADFLHACVR